jgi:hypothetical protein
MICAWIIPVLTGRHAVRWPGGHKSAPWALPTGWGQPDGEGAN